MITWARPITFIIEPIVGNIFRTLRVDRLINDFHICSCYIRRDEKKRVKRALIALEFSSPNYHKQVNLYYEYGFRENLAFEILQ